MACSRQFINSIENILTSNILDGLPFLREAYGFMEFVLMFMLHFISKYIDTKNGVSRYWETSSGVSFWY